MFSLDNKNILIRIRFKSFHQIHFFQPKQYYIKQLWTIQWENTFRNSIQTQIDIFVSENITFDTLRNCKRRNKGNFMLKSNSNKIMLCGGGGQHILGLNKISTLWFHFLGLFTVFKWIKQYFPRKTPKNIYCYC